MPPPSQTPQMTPRTPKPPYWRGPILFGLALLVVALALTLVIGHYLRLHIVGKLALAQVLLEALLIPLAAVAFWEAREAVRRSASSPELRVMLLGEDGQLREAETAAIDPGEPQDRRITFALDNTGDAVAVWWQATFDIPVELMHALRLRGTAQVLPRHVQHITMDTVGLFQRYRVQSLGEVASFPGVPVEIASLHFKVPFDKNWSTDFVIPYTIMTDRSQIVSGQIPLAFVPGLPRQET